MILNIRFPDNLDTEILLEKGDIPCVCRVSNIFEVEFIRPLNTIALGTVDEWDLREIGYRVPGRGGGKYIYHNFAKISLNYISEGNMKLQVLVYIVKEWAG